MAEMDCLTLSRAEHQNDMMSALVLTPKLLCVPSLTNRAAIDGGGSGRADGVC